MRRTAAAILAGIALTTALVLPTTTAAAPQTVTAGPPTPTTAPTTHPPPAQRPGISAGMKSAPPSAPKPRPAHRVPVVGGPILTAGTAKPPAPRPTPTSSSTPAPPRPHTAPPTSTTSAGYGDISDVPQPWRALAWCESGRDGSWRVTSTSYYRGRFQFAPFIWRMVGGTGDPAAATIAEQLRRARRLLAIQGWRAWPVCSRIIGLR